MAAKREKNGGKRKARVFLTEDHGISRFGLARLISQQPDLFVCGEADNVPQALTAIRQLKPDLVMVDLELREGSGLDLIQGCKGQDPAPRILVVSMHDETLHAETALSAGAHGYVMKEQAIEHVLAAIRRVLQGKIYLSERMVDLLVERRLQTNRGSESSPLERLSTREKEVLQLIGQWQRTQAIATHLKLSVKTIEYYRHRLKEKLNLSTATELTQFATEWLRQRERQ